LGRRERGGRGERFGARNGGNGALGGLEKENSFSLCSPLFLLFLPHSLAQNQKQKQQGSKFNTKKEDVVGETYLGIQVKREKEKREKKNSESSFFAALEKETRISNLFLSLTKKKKKKQVYRFYLRCSACSAEITFKTDPANTGYAVEAGATRNYEPWRDKEDGEGGGGGGEGNGGGGGVGDEAEDPGGGTATASNPPPVVPSGPVPGDAMAALEARALESRREMATLDALDELRAINASKERVNVDAALAALRGEANKNGKASQASNAASSNPISAAALEAEEDERAVREMLLARAGAVRRIEDEDEEEERERGGDGGAAPSAAPAPAAAPAAVPPVIAASKRPAAATPALVVLKKKKKVKEAREEEEEEKATANGGGGSGGSDGEGGGGGEGDGGGGLAGLLGGYGSSSPSS